MRISHARGRSRAQSALPWLLLVVLLLPGLAARAQVNELASGLSSPIGVDLDEANHHLYFVEWTSGDLKRQELLPPGCDVAMPATCPAPTVVASGFHHPEDVVVLPDLGSGYVTTRDDPGTTGALWRVDLATGAPTLVAFNLGAPHQIAVDPLNNTAYVTAYDLGRLWRIDLTTGVKTTVTSGLDHPVGLVITSDRTRAYVTEQGAADRLIEIDLTTGAVVREVAAGFPSGFFLAWSDPSEVAVYLVERDPANRLMRVDVVSSETVEVATGLPFRPSGVAVSYQLNGAFVTTASTLQRVDLGSLPLTEPVFLGVGHVPSSEIDSNGYATTAPGYFFQVKHAPFGGALNVFGNLSGFRAPGINATHYRVEVSNDGGVTWKRLTPAWTAYRWNASVGKFEATTVAPDGDGRYEIPPEYPSHPQRWYPTFLMMRWPTSQNGLHKLQVELWRKTGATWHDVTSSLPPGGNSLVLQIDNTPPVVDLVSILRHGTTTVIQPCEIADMSTIGALDFKITAHDPNRHLLSYHLWVLWGKDESSSILTDTYTGGPSWSATPPDHVDEDGPYGWSGVSNQILTQPASGWAPCCDCAHTFRLRAWKRTINGYHRILYGDSHQSVTLTNTGFMCPKPGCP